MASSSNMPSSTAGNYPPANRIPQGKESFSTFLWNSQTNAFLGRTGTSWAKIGGFYVIFYLFLAGFFGLIFAVFYQTIDYNMPTYTGEASVLRKAGLGYRPNVLEQTDKKSILTYDLSDNKTTDAFVKDINKLLDRYENQNSGTHQTCTNNTKSNEKPCGVDWRQINTTCNPANSWGYLTTSPCIIFKLNRMIDFMPEPLKNIRDLPKSLQAHINKTATNSTDAMAKNVWVWCETSEEEDVVLEQPSPGLPLHFYPYRNQPSYLSPLIIVRVYPKVGETASVVCKVWAANIDHKSNRRLTGMAEFRITVQNSTKTETDSE